MTDKQFKAADIIIENATTRVTPSYFTSAQILLQELQSTGDNSLSLQDFELAALALEEDKFIATVDRGTLPEAYKIKFRGYDYREKCKSYRDFKKDEEHKGKKDKKIQNRRYVITTTVAGLAVIAASFNAYSASKNRASSEVLGKRVTELEQKILKSQTSMDSLIHINNSSILTK